MVLFFFLVWDDYASASIFLSINGERSISRGKPNARENRVTLFPKTRKGAWDD